ncbi:Uncharacterized protein F37A4.6 [Toxocara canis]|uniref:Uncharacterized protein F37A4.6 n=1 Tax=Toxocara canis TaxID=6265 RepID=A0A0B2V6C1_TOXCA|nr:Uncharacterized protein F37A4.6 [Toxocara canis]
MSHLPKWHTFADHAYKNYSINNGVITRSATQSSSHLTKNEPSPPLSDYQPDYPLLQYILYQGYKMSIPYDRLNHCRSMNKIKGRLQKVLQPFAHLDPSRSPACGTLSYSDESARTISSTVPSSASIKSTRSQQNATPTSHSANASEGLRLSRSMNNITAAVNQKRNHSNTTKGNSTSGSRKHRLKQKIPTPHQLSTESNHGTTGRLVRYGSQESNNSRSSIGRRSSLSDASNFHATQYLVFPVKDKSQEPILIHFPQDVIENDDNRLKGTWGSDTSLEEDAEIAPKIRGDLQLTSEDDDDGLRADGMHAPYNDHL